MRLVYGFNHFQGFDVIFDTGFKRCIIDNAIYKMFLTCKYTISRKPTFRGLKGGLVGRLSQRFDGYLSIGMKDDATLVTLDQHFSKGKPGIVV